MSDFDRFERIIQQRQSQQLYRERHVLDSAQACTVVVDGQPVINFSSNDYLNLANHPSVKKALVDAVDSFGVGSGASHLVSGHSRWHHQLEEELAMFTGRDRAMVFSSGYMANLGTINALVEKGDFIFEDKLNHASLLDGGLISGAKFQRFLHNDLQSLENKLVKVVDSPQQKLIVVDGVFSMDGDETPITDLVALSKKYKALLMVDDAHGFGVLGDRGAGIVEKYGLDQGQVPVLMATLGKSVGVFGAFVAGSETLIDGLIQTARPYIYTTALPSSLAAAACESLKIIQQDVERRESLHNNIDHFKSAAANVGLPLLDSLTAIQPVIIGDNEKVMALQQALFTAGFLVGAIRPPTVPAGTARLRITINAEHQTKQIDALVEAIARSLA